MRCASTCSSDSLRARIWLTSVFRPSISRRSSPASSAALGQVLFGAAALAGHGFQFHLALRHGLGELLARDFEPLDLGGGHLLFARGTRRLAVDAGQVLFDLRQLVLQRGGLAEQAQNHLAAGLDGALALADLEPAVPRAAG